MESQKNGPASGHVAGMSHFLPMIDHSTTPSVFDKPLSHLERLRYISMDTTMSTLIHVGRAAHGNGRVFAFQHVL